MGELLWCMVTVEVRRGLLLIILSATGRWLLHVLLGVVMVMDCLVLVWIGGRGPVLLDEAELALEDLAGVLVVHLVLIARHFNG